MAEDFTTQVTNPDGTMTEMSTELVNPDGTPNYQAILALLSQNGLGAGLQGAPQLQALIQQIGQLASQQGQPQPAPAQSQQPQAKPAQDTSTPSSSKAQPAPATWARHGFNVPGSGSVLSPAAGRGNGSPSAPAAQDTANWQTAQGAQMVLPGQPNVTNAPPATGQPGTWGGSQPGDTGTWDTGTGNTWTPPSATWTMPGQRAGGNPSQLPTQWLGGGSPPDYATAAVGSQGQLPDYASAVGGGQGAGGDQLPTMQSAYGAGGGQGAGGDQLPTMQSAYGAGGGLPPTLTWRTPQGAGGGQLPDYQQVAQGQLPNYQQVAQGQLPDYQQAVQGQPARQPWEAV